MNIVLKRLSLLLAVILIISCALPANGESLAEEAAKDPFANAIPTLPTLSIAVEYDKPTIEGTLSGRATIVCNPPKSPDATVFDAEDVIVTIDLTDELRLAEGCEQEFSIGTLASGESRAFPFTLEFDTEYAQAQAADKKIIPVMTITALSEEIGGCRYTCELDVTPEANLFLCSINTAPFALNTWFMNESAAALEKTFDELYYEREDFSIRRFDMDISDPAAQPFSAVLDAMEAIETDENDLICLYLSACAPTDEENRHASFASILNGKEKPVDYSELFEWIDATLDCRVIVLIDCATAADAFSAASSLDQDYCSVIAIDLHGEAQNFQSSGYRMQGLFAQTIFDYMETETPGASLSEFGGFFGSDHAANNFFTVKTGKSLGAVAYGNPLSPVFAMDPKYHSDIWILAVKEERLEWISPFGNEVILTTTVESFNDQKIISNIAIPTFCISSNVELEDTLNALVSEYVADAYAAREEMMQASLVPDTTLHQVNLYVDDCFATDRVLSFAIGFHQYYSGGAHGIHGARSYNYDLQTGETLSIHDMLDPKEANAEKRLNTLIENQLTLHYGDDLWTSAKDVANNFLAGEMGYWKMNKEGLCVFFDEYEVGPYFIGYAAVTIPYAQLEYVFDGEFIPDVRLSVGEGEIINAADPRVSDKNFRAFGKPQTNAFIVDGNLTQITGTDSVFGGGICFYANSMRDAYAWLPDGSDAITVTWADAAGTQKAYIPGS